MSKVHLVLGFPGVGKSTICKDERYVTYDSDSGDFDKNDFPRNYVDHIKGLIKKHEEDGVDRNVYIFCSTHDVVRMALDDEKMKYTLVYPDDHCKMEYLKRYRDRGSPEGFVRIMERNFDAWQQQCANYSAYRKFRLLPGQYLSDIIGFFQ